MRNRLSTAGNLIASPGEQLKEIYIDGELDTVDSTIWLPKVMRKDYVVGLNLSGSGPDPDQNLYLLYGCGGDLNYNGHCNPEIDALIDQQSTEANQEKRRRLVWEIERKLAEDGARPIRDYAGGVFAVYSAAGRVPP